MADELFIPGPYKGEELYGIIRDAETGCYEGDFRSYCQTLWTTYEPFADTDFRERLRQDFNARFWEMYLTCTLIEQSAAVRKKQGNTGPDILIDLDGQNIWVEAIAPSSGAEDNPDRVPNVKYGEVFTDPEEQIVLRYSSAIREKYGKYIQYRHDGTVASNDAYVIAVNSAKINLAFDHDIPRILKALFPLGERFHTFDKDFKIEVNSGYKHRPVIERTSGAPVNTQIFNDPTYAGISAVLYSRAGCGTYPTKMGEDFVFVHNPVATNKIKHGFIRSGREYIPQDKENTYKLSLVDWNIA